MTSHFLVTALWYSGCLWSLFAQSQSSSLYYRTSYNLTLSPVSPKVYRRGKGREGLRRLLLNNSLANCCVRLAGKIHARTRASDRHPARIHKPRAKRHRGHFMARLPPQLYCSNTSQFSPCRCESLIVSSLVSSLSQSATIVARMLITVHTLQKR